MFSSFQMGFRLPHAAEVCAALARISAFYPCSLIMAPKVFVNCCKFFPSHCYSCCYWLSTICHQLSLLSSNFHAISWGCLIQVGYQSSKFFFIPCQATNIISKPKAADSVSSNADCDRVFAESINHDALQEDVKKCWRQETSLMDSDCCVKPITNSAMDEYSTGGFTVD